MPPYHPLKEVKTKIRSGDVFLKPNAINEARYDFNWGPSDIKRCLLKLNDREHRTNPDKNHYYKTEKHRHFPHTMMDYYKARRVMEGESIYTHYYIKRGDTEVVVSSFHELDFF